MKHLLCTALLAFTCGAASLMAQENLNKNIGVR